MIKACKMQAILIPYLRMKKTIAALGVGASLMVAISSCTSSDVYEPTSNYTVPEGEIPIWLLEGSEEEQIAAESTSQNRNDTYIPDETETMASVNASTSSQVQPEHIAQNPPPPTEDVPFIETPPVDTPTFTPVTTPEQTAVATVTPKPKPQTKPQTSTTTKPKKPQGKKPTQKFTEPTLITYTVRKGDNLHDIAKRSRTTIAQIKRDSGLKGDTIYPGQVIKVRYIPKDYKPGKKTTTDTAAKPRVHVVAKGETISGIAKKYGIPYTQVLKANNLSLSDASKIRPGKRLTIPAAAAKNNNKKKK